MLMGLRMVNQKSINLVPMLGLEYLFLFYVGLIFSIGYADFCFPIPVIGCILTFSSILCMTGNHNNLSVFSVKKRLKSKHCDFGQYFAMNYILRGCCMTVGSIFRVFLPDFFSVVSSEIWKRITFSFGVSAILATKEKEAKLALF